MLNHKGKPSEFFKVIIDAKGFLLLILNKRYSYGFITSIIANPRIWLIFWSGFMMSVKNASKMRLIRKLIKRKK